MTLELKTKRREIEFSPRSIFTPKCFTPYFPRVGDIVLNNSRRELVMEVYPVTTVAYKGPNAIVERIYRDGQSQSHVISKDAYDFYKEQLEASEISRN